MILVSLSGVRNHEVSATPLVPTRLLLSLRDRHVEVELWALHSPARLRQLSIRQFHLVSITNAFICKVRLSTLISERVAHALRRGPARRPYSSTLLLLHRQRVVSRAAIR